MIITVVAMLGSLATTVAGPIWEKPTLFLGSLDVDGGLRQRFELGVLSGSPEFSFLFYLEHRFSVDEAVTEYGIPQLETYVVPEGRDQILWLEPGGNRHVFNNREILRKAPDGQKEPWIAIRDDAGNNEFRSDDGWIYRYESGAIVSLTAPSGRVLRFETEGLRILRIYQEAAGREINLLESKDNDLGMFKSLTIGAVTHEFRYDPDGRRITEWRSPQMGARSVDFIYSAKGLIEEVRLPDGQKLDYTWGGRDGAWQKDSGFELPAKENGAYLISDGHFKFSYGMTKEGINLMRTDALGISEGFVLDLQGRQLVRKNRDGGQVVEFLGGSGASRGRLESARDARGREVVRMTYDEKGRVLEKQAFGEAGIRFKYDSLDRITRVFRLDELVKSYEYLGDSEKPVKITDALGHTVEIGYTSSGQIDHYKNSDGAVYSFIYDALGQLTEELLPMGYRKTIQRDVLGRVVRVKEPDGRENSYQYTTENRIASVNEGGTVWDYEYSSEGELSRLLKNGRTWQKTERERVADSGGSIVSGTNAMGDETVIHFDSQGNLVKKVDALGQKTTYKHNATGRLTGWEDPRGTMAELEFDATGRVSEVDTGDSSLVMKYDSTGRLRQRDTGEREIRYKYDNEGRLLQIDYGKGETIDYTYDFYGRMRTAMTGQGVKTTCTWDALDNKTSERTDLPGGSWTLLNWTYTAGGRKQTVEVRNSDMEGGPSADRDTSFQLTRYEYDALGRYTLVSVNGEPKVWYDYDPKNLRLLRKRYFNGWVVAYKHFTNGYPESIVATDGKGNVVTDCRYVWNEYGKLDQRILNGIHHRYQYDPLGRLTDVVKTESLNNRAAVGGAPDVPPGATRTNLPPPHTNQKFQQNRIK